MLIRKLNKTINQVDKAMPARDGMSIAKDLQDIKFDIMQDITDTIKEDYFKGREPGETIDEWLDRQPDEYFKRIKLSDGGKVIDFAAYAKMKEPKIKKINLAQGDFEKTVADVTESDKELIKKLLRMSGVNVGGDK